MNSKLQEYCLKHRIGHLISRDGKYLNTLAFSQNDVDLLREMNNLKLWGNGGLVVGNLHVEGGIHLITGDETIGYRCHMEMEGWEFVSPVIAEENNEYELEFENWNKQFEEFDDTLSTDFDIPRNCPVIDVSDNDCPFILTGGGKRVIINRLATREFIHEIMDLSQKIITENDANGM